MRQLVAAFVLASACAASSAEPTTTAARSELEQLFESGQYPQFLKRAKLLADHGNVEANFLLGKAYDLGKGVDKDVDRARRYYEAAAVHNHARALNNLGVIHLHEDADPGAAASNFERAIALGLKTPATQNPAAAHKELCMRDQTSSCDDARKLYLKLWETEKKTSHLDDAVMVQGRHCFVYNDGERQRKGGVATWSEPCKIAIALAEQGVALGLGRSSYNRGAIELDGGHPVQAIPWFKLAVERGEGLGAYSLGKMYEDGNGVPKDKAEMLAWYKRGAALKNGYALKRMHKYWEEHVETADTQGEIREAMNELARLTPDASALARARERIARMEILDANATSLPALAGKPINSIFCPFASDGSDLDWWIVPISTDKDVNGMERLATGNKDAKGCVTFGAKGLAAMRKAMARGHSLVLHWSGQGHLMYLQAGSKGTLEFVLRSDDDWDYGRP